MSDNGTFVNVGGSAGSDENALGQVWQAVKYAKVEAAQQLQATEQHLQLQHDEHVKQTKELSTDLAQVMVGHGHLAASHQQNSRHLDNMRAAVAALDEKIKAIPPPAPAAPAAAPVDLKPLWLATNAACQQINEVARGHNVLASRLDELHDMLQAIPEPLPIPKIPASWPPWVAMVLAVLSAVVQIALHLM